jgi:hypothetical protein
MYGGWKNCSIYVTVECDFSCVYNVSFIVSQTISDTSLFPSFLVDNNYVNGQVEYNKTKYYYFPV